MMLVTVTPHRHLELARERVDRADADALHPRCDVDVRPLPGAGMQLGEDALECGHRDAAPVVLDGDTWTVDVDVDGVREASEVLVDRVADHLVEHVVHARAIVGVADEHAVCAARPRAPSRPGSMRRRTRLLWPRMIVPISARFSSAEFSELRRNNNALCAVIERFHDAMDRTA
jgi:hypothetical protein